MDVLKVSNPFLLGLNDMKSMKMQIDVEAMTWKVDGSPELPLLEKDKHISAACVRSYTLPTNPVSENKTSESALVVAKLVIPSITTAFYVMSHLW
jgi:hypothetical protein